MASSIGLTHFTSSGVSFPATRRRWNGGSRVGTLRVFASETKQQEPDLSINVNGLHMPNPFVIGSGPPGTNYKVMKKAFDEGWGAVIAPTSNPVNNPADDVRVLKDVTLMFCLAVQQMMARFRRL